MTKSQKACRAVRSAKTGSQVINAVQQYLHSLNASDAAQLPKELLVVGLTPAEELIQSALQALHDCITQKGDAPKGGVVRETMLVFTTAARRLAILAKDPA